MKIKNQKFFHKVYECPKFQTWSGAGLPHQHHYGDGGLMKHTLEVLEYARANAHVASSYHGHEIDMDVLELSCLYHDLGKIHDYEKVDGVWQKSPHCRNIHHISRSAIIWSDDFRESDIKDEKLFEDVLHCILAHHGGREYGSPVAPKSREAWILHLSDNLSARMSDADTNDLIKNK